MLELKAETDSSDVVLKFDVIYRCPNDSIEGNNIIISKKADITIWKNDVINVECKEKSGPSTDPWGTPDNTFNKLEEQPLTTVNCSLFVR